MKVSFLTTAAALIGFVVSIASVATPANATTYEFSFSYSGTIDGTAVSGSGTLFGTLVSGDTYLLTSGFGTSTEAGNLTLEPAGTYINTLAPTVNLTSDNLLLAATDPFLDGNGLVFQGSTLVSNSNYFDIWGDGPGSYTYFNNYDSNQYSSGAVNFSIESLGPVATPLPSTWTMLIAGFAGLGYLAFRSTRKSSGAPAMA